MTIQILMIQRHKHYYSYIATKTFRTFLFQHLQMMIPILMIPRHYDTAKLPQNFVFSDFILISNFNLPILFWSARKFQRDTGDDEMCSWWDLWIHYLSGHHPSPAIIGTQRINFQPTLIKRGSWGQNTQVWAGRNNLLIQTGRLDVGVDEGKNLDKFESGHEMLTRWQAA